MAKGKEGLLTGAVEYELCLDLFSVMYVVWFCATTCQLRLNGINAGMMSTAGSPLLAIEHFPKW